MQLPDDSLGHFCGELERRFTVRKNREQPPQRHHRLPFQPRLHRRKGARERDLWFCRVETSNEGLRQPFLRQREDRWFPPELGDDVPARHRCIRSSGYRSRQGDGSQLQNGRIARLKRELIDLQPVDVGLRCNRTLRQTIASFLPV